MEESKTLYRVTGGGFYRFVINNRSYKASRWLRKDQPLKKTEREELTEAEALEVIERNNKAFMKMAGVKMEAVENV